MEKKIMSDSEDDKEYTVKFAPGCFDDFEGTQEELDDLILEIHRMVDTGELFENAELVDFDELGEYDDEVGVVIDKYLERQNDPKRLH